MSDATSTPSAQASVEELTKQEFIYHEDQSDPSGEASAPQEELSKTQIIMDVVKSLRTGKDLYRISLPAALLKPVSMLEYIGLFITPQSFFINICNMNDPEQRMITVVKWWIGNMAHIPKKGIMGAKPYNAILGETFMAKFIHSDSKTLMVAEQVSHHPPISAIYMTNRVKNFALKAVLKPKSKFHGNSASTLLDGEIIIQLLSNGLKEQYSIVFPHVVAKGLIWGQQGLEMNDFLKIKCDKTGLSAKIEFLVKKENGVKGSIKRNGTDKLYKITGCLTDKVMIKSLTTKNSSVLVDVPAMLNNSLTGGGVFGDKSTLKYVKPVNKQQVNESRRVWHKVSYALNKNKYDDANVHKNAVEEEQRAIRKMREQNQAKPHELVLFKQEGESYRFIHENVSEHTVDEPDLEKLLMPVDQDEIDFIKRYAPQSVFAQSASQ